MHQVAIDLNGQIPQAILLHDANGDALAGFLGDGKRERRRSDGAVLGGDGTQQARSHGASADGDSRSQNAEHDAQITGSVHGQGRSHEPPALCGATAPGAGYTLGPWCLSRAARPSGSASS